MPEQSPGNRDELRPVLDDLSYAATQARVLGPAGRELADEVAALVERYVTGKPAQPAADNTTGGYQVGAAAAVGHVPAAVPDHGDDADEYAYEEDDYDDDEDDYDDDFVPANQITLHVRRDDGMPMNAEQAKSAVGVVSASIAEVFGSIDGDATVVAIDGDDEALAHVTLTIAEHDGTSSLNMVGVGQDGFNARFPLIGLGTVTITSRVEAPEVAEPDDVVAPGVVDLGDVAGAVAPDGEGHPINALAVAGDGERLRAVPQLVVEYTKVGGTLTEEKVREIIAHPISQMGLERLGTSVLTDVVEVDPATWQASFLFDQPGEIDLATLAIGATAYQGSFDFGGDLGVVKARALAPQLVDAVVNGEL